MSDKGSNVVSITAGKVIENLSERNNAPGADTAVEPLKGGGGGGTSDDMEARVSRLERQMDTVAKDVSDMRVDVAGIKENVRHLPTKPWMFATLGGMLTVLGAFVALVVRFIPHA